DAWPGRLARTPGPDAWPGRLARTPGPDAWPGRLARTPGPDAWPAAPGPERLARSAWPGAPGPERRARSRTACRPASGPLASRGQSARGGFAAQQSPALNSRLSRPGDVGAPAAGAGPGDRQGAGRGHE